MIERDLRGSTAAGPPGHGMRERLTVYGFFVIMGIGTSAWISRLPTVKARLGLQPSGLALMTILGGSGALIGMLVSGVLTDQLGVRKAMLLAASTWCMGMLIVALAVTLRSVPGVVLGLLFNSAGISLWGTVNTVEAGAVERFSSRSIMPRFHASYSLGMFLALGLGSCFGLGFAPVSSGCAHHHHSGNQGSGHGRSAGFGHLDCLLRGLLDHPSRYRLFGRSYRCQTSPAAFGG